MLLAIQAFQACGKVLLQSVEGILHIYSAVLVLFLVFKIHDAPHWEYKKIKQKKKNLQVKRANILHFLSSRTCFWCCLRNWPQVEWWNENTKKPDSFLSCRSARPCPGQRCIGASLERRSWRAARTGRIRPCRPHSGAPRPWPHSPCLYNMWWGDTNTHMHTGAECGPRGDRITWEFTLKGSFEVPESPARKS